MSRNSTFAQLPLDQLAQKYGTPFYLYDLTDIESRYKTLTQSLGARSARVHYAMKANSNPAILKLFRRLGAGVDTVSGGEIRLALNAGFAPQDIIFSGVGKTAKELRYAIELGLKQINVESEGELQKIMQLSRELQRPVNIALRFNPDVDAQTHPYISTGIHDNKFGLDAQSIRRLIPQLWESRDHVHLVGLTIHIGSQILELDVLQEAVEAVLKLHSELTQLGFSLSRLDVGGGVGIRYDLEDSTLELNLLKSYGQWLTSRIPKSLEILVEPGRCLVARAGLLVCQVLYIKEAPKKTFAIVDTGMHHLLRPALYEAVHRIVALQKQESVKTQNYDVVGPICESSDFLGKSVALPTLKPDDFLAIMDVGAYGQTMSSQYNAQLPAQEFVYDGTSVQRETSLLT